MARPDRLIRQYLRVRFIVTMKNGTAWSAVLLDADTNTLILADCSLLASDGTPTKADTQVFLPRADVAYMQRA